MTITTTRPPQFSAPTLSAPAAAALGQAAALPKDHDAVEARVIEKLRALLRDGRGSMMITVTPGAVQFFRFQPDGRMEIG